MSGNQSRRRPGEWMENENIWVILRVGGTATMLSLLFLVEFGKGTLRGSRLGWICLCNESCNISF